MTRTIEPGQPLREMLHLSLASFHFAPYASSLILLFSLLRSCTSGVSLLLIIPLLQAIGFPLMGQRDSALTSKVQAFFAYCHIPLALGPILVLFVAVIAVVASIHLVETLMRSSLSERYQLHWRETIYGLVSHIQYAFFIQKSNSALLHSVTTELQAACQSLTLLQQCISQSILIGVYVILSYCISWQMTAIASAIGVALLALMRPLHRLTVRAGHHYLSNNQKLLHVFYEQLCGGLKMIKSCGSENLFIEKALKMSQTQRTITGNLTIVHALSKWLYVIGSGLAFSALLYLSIAYVQLSLELLFLQLLVFSRLLPLVSTLQQYYQQLLRYLPSYTHLRALQQEWLLHQEPYDKKHQLALTFCNTIRFDKVSFRYQEDLPFVIEHLSLHIPKNLTTVFVGASGSGKTTIADLLLGLLIPNEGTIYIDKQPLQATHLYAWRKSVAYVPQDAFLFHATVRENLELFCGSQSDTALWEMLARVAAKDFVSRLPLGLDTVVGDRGVRLSGGERQRLAIARALLMAPQLLILDESTNALDGKTIESIQETLSALRGQMTVVIITHQEQMLDFADVVYQLSVREKEKTNVFSSCELS